MGSEKEKLEIEKRPAYEGDIIQDISFIDEILMCLGDKNITGAEDLLSDWKHDLITKYEEQSMTDFKLAAVEERKADLEEFKYRFSFIPEFLKDVKEFDEGLQKICKEGNCFTTLGLRLLDSYIELLGEHFGVSDEDLYWHIYDNDLGRLKKSLRVNGKEFVIGSAGDLFKALKTTEK